MSKFNTPILRAKKTINKAGGKAYSTTAEFQLISILLTSFVKDQYYRKEKDSISELKQAIEKCNPLFAVKAILYTRREFGMRSISHIAATFLAPRINGEGWGKSFFEKVVYRVDDMLEIYAFHLSQGGRMMPNAMKKGFRKAFDKFDAYQLAKYRADKKQVKLIDIVNLVHPKGNKKNAKALKQLVEGTLRNESTWETKLSETGKEGSKATKKEAWGELLENNKLGYFALLRNFKNILEDAPDYIDLACNQLVNENAIKKSLILPFRFLSAYMELAKNKSNNPSRMLRALSKAAEISCSNVPVFDGKTLVVLDVSGSMTWDSNNKNGIFPATIGALFSAAILKRNLYADFMTFDGHARYQYLNTFDSLFTIVNSIKFTGGGTDFRPMFAVARKAYDRIIILSDMQGWIGDTTPKAAFNDYKKRFDCSPYIYSFDLTGYGSLQFPQNKCFAIAGFSEKIFDVMKLLETDKNALINKINSIQLK